MTVCSMWMKAENLLIKKNLFKWIEIAIDVLMTGFFIHIRFISIIFVHSELSYNVTVIRDVIFRFYFNFSIISVKQNEIK